MVKRALKSSRAGEHPSAAFKKESTQRGGRRIWRKVGIAIATVALIGSGIVSSQAGLLVAADAVPGTPGQPSAPAELFSEDFDNRPLTSNILLDQYVGVTGQTYTADPNWINAAFCNGMIIDSNTAGGILEECRWVRYLTSALGIIGGTNPANNAAVTAYTALSPGANKVQFQTATPITMPIANRFVSFSIDVAAQNCTHPGAVQPQMFFTLVDQSGSHALNQSAINACNSPSVGPNGVQGGRVTTDMSILAAGSSFDIVLRNAQGGSTGNDAAFDNIRMLDVSPQLDKSFSPASVPVGGISTLTFTITNTSELNEKNGWAFTDTLPSGLVIASSPNTQTTCSAADVVAPAGENVITITQGKLAKGEVSCSISVDVTSESPRGAEPSPVVYTNGADNISGQIGINNPNDATVQFYSTPVLAVTKSSDATEDTRVGDVVNYTVTAKNTGTADFTDVDPALLIDDLTGVLDDTEEFTVSDASANRPGVLDFTNPRLSWKGALAVDATVTLTYSVTVAEGGDRTAKNIAFVGDPSHPDIPGGPTPDPDDCVPGVTSGAVSCTEFKLPKLTVTKVANPTDSLAPGDVVTYTVTATNSGPGTFTNTAPAVITDDLSGVIDDHTYMNDATVTPAGGSLAYNEPLLSWRGPLASGASAAIVYTVTLGVDGDGTVRNIAFVGDGDTPNNCEADSNTCDEVEFPVVQPGLKWQKVSAAPQSERLGGSEWSLVPLDGNGDEDIVNAITVVDCVANDAADCDVAGGDIDPEKGRMLVKPLAPGDYKLKETKAPVGYKLLEDPIDVTITKNGLDAEANFDLGEIVNDQQAVPAIPLTGGVGSFSFMLGAGGIAAAAAALIMIRARRQKLAAAQDHELV